MLVPQSNTLQTPRLSRFIEGASFACHPDKVPVLPITSASMTPSAPMMSTTAWLNSMLAESATAPVSRENIRDLQLAYSDARVHPRRLDWGANPFTDAWVTSVSRIRSANISPPENAPRLPPAAVVETREPEEMLLTQWEKFVWWMEHRR